MGKRYVSVEFAFLMFLVIAAALLAYMGEFWLTVAAAALAYIYGQYFLFTIPEFSFGVRARLDQVLAGVDLDGLGFRVLGDQVHVVRRNPVNVEIAFERQLMDDRVAKGKLRVTMRPDPRIGDARGINRYAAWVLQERWGIEKEGYALHHVQEAIEAPLKSLLYSLLGSIKSDQLDRSLHGLALFVESEVGTHTPPHRDPDFCQKLVGWGKPDEPKVEELLNWYTEHHRAISEHLRALDQEFEDNPAKPLNPKCVSHGEAHTSTTLEEVAIIEFGYDATTTQAGQDRYAAEKRREVMKQYVQDLRDKEVEADTAAVLAAGAINAAEVKGNVVAGGRGGNTLNVIDNQTGGKH